MSKTPKSPGSQDPAAHARELVRWLDGELPEREAEAFARRMESEPGLRREMEDLSELERLLEQWPESSEAPDVRGAVLARIDRDPNEDVGWRILPRTWRMPVWAASWAACGILLAFAFLGIIEIQPGGETDDPSTSWEVASLDTDEDISFAEYLDQVLEVPGSPVDSMATWLDADEVESGGEALP